MSAWVKWTAGAAGALVGAAACGIVVIMVWFAVEPAPQYHNWDFATPLLMLAFAAGAWDGRWNTLVEALQGDGGCPGLRAVAAARQFDLPQRVELQSERRDVAPMRVSYRPLSDRNGFDLSVSGTKRAYLLDSSGHWHVTGFVQQAREEDPAPAPCEIDQSQPCEG